MCYRKNNAVLTFHPRYALDHVLDYEGMTLIFSNELCNSAVLLNYTEILYFPAKQIYHIVVAIKGLLKPGQTPDFTRNGVSNGYVVIPEFPGFLSVSLIMALMIGMILLIQS